MGTVHAFYPLEASSILTLVTTRNVSRHHLESSEGAKVSPLRTIVLGCGPTGSTPKAPSLWACQSPLTSLPLFVPFGWRQKLLSTGSSPLLTLLSQSLDLQVLPCFELLQDLLTGICLFSSSQPKHQFEMTQFIVVELKNYNHLEKKS